MRDHLRTCAATALALLLLVGCSTATDGSTSGRSHSPGPTSSGARAAGSDGSAAPRASTAPAALTPSVDPDAPIALSAVDACALLTLEAAQAVLGPDAAVPTPNGTATEGPDDGSHCEYSTPVDPGRNALTSLALLVFAAGDTPSLANRAAWLAGSAASPLCRGDSDRPVQSNPPMTRCTFAPVTVASVVEGGQQLADTVYPGTPVTVAHGTSVLWWQGGLVFELVAVASNVDPIALSVVTGLAGRIAVDVG